MLSPRVFAYYGLMSSSRHLPPAYQMDPCLCFFDFSRFHRFNRFSDQIIKKLQLNLDMIVRNLVKIFQTYARFQIFFLTARVSSDMS